MLDAKQPTGLFQPSPHQIAAALFIVVFTLLATGIVGYLALDPNTNLDLKEGDVAPVDIRAPADSSFESAILTEQKRQEEVTRVRTVYTTDDEVARRQVDRVRLVMDYIEHVRHDPFASRAQKLSDLNAIDDVGLESDHIATILSLNDTDWRRVRDQVNAVLSNIMRDEVREEDLPGIYERIPRHSVLFPLDQEEVITTLVSELVRANTAVDPEATEAARETARETVAPVVRSFRRGQIMVERGKVITNLDLEALNKLGLLSPTHNSRGTQLAAALLAVLLGEMVIALYVARFHSRLLEDLQVLFVLGVLFLLALALARVMIMAQEGSGIIYLYPGAALALLVTGLVGPQLAILVVLVLGFLVGMIANSLEIMVVVTVGGIVSVLYLRRTERLNAFFKAGSLAGVANAGVILAFGLTDFNPDVPTLLMSAAAGLVNGVLAAAVALAGLFLLGSTLNMTTGLLLADLGRSDHPLLQRLMREAPGTYQHSLLVANLAEAAAEAIDANTLLVRVGALYHDIGKMYRPALFVENYTYGDSQKLHQKMSPRESARAIIKHVTLGEQMARQYRLPTDVRDFILEHQGTTMPGFFWQKALKEAGGDESQLDKHEFFYPGPKPQSRETAIVMIADSCESAMRAVRPSGEEAIAALVNKIISGKANQGQLDECDLTFRDLDLIRDTIVRSLKGVFHPRIAYPEDEKPAVEAAPPLPAAPTRQAAGGKQG